MFLLILAVPSFSRKIFDELILSSWAPELPPPLVMALVFVAYTMIVYAVIVWTFGMKGLTQMLAVAIVLALTVVLTMSALSKTPIVGEFFRGSKSLAQIDAMAIEQFFTMMVVLPLGLLIIHSFPPVELLSRFRSPSGTVSERAIKLAIVLRIYSLVIDAIGAFYIAWSEENPTVILPRHRKDIGGTEKLWKLPLWFIGASATWGLALVTNCIEQIPQLVSQLDVTLDRQTKGNK